MVFLIIEIITSQDKLISPYHGSSAELVLIGLNRELCDSQLMLLPTIPPRHSWSLKYNIDNWWIWLEIFILYKIILPFSIILSTYLLKNIFCYKKMPKCCEITIPCKGLFLHSGITAWIGKRILLRLLFSSICCTIILKVEIRLFFHFKICEFAQRGKIRFIGNQPCKYLWCKQCLSFFNPLTADGKLSRHENLTFLWTWILGYPCFFV